MTFVSSLLTWVGFGKKPKMRKMRRQKLNDTHLGKHADYGERFLDANANAEGVRLEPVSRHSLAEDDVYCPICGDLVARKGDWHLISGRPRIDRSGPIDQRYVDEYLTCHNCSTMLLASPDSDIDPISPDESGNVEYDKSIYHRFHRDQIQIKPRFSNKTAGIGDTVFVDSAHAAATDHKLADLHAIEGRVTNIRYDAGGPVATIEPFTMGTMAGEMTVQVPTAYIKVLRSCHHAVGKQITVIRGEYAGHRGIITKILEPQVGQYANREIEVELTGPSGHRSSKRVEVPQEIIETVE